MLHDTGLRTHPVHSFVWYICVTNLFVNIHENHRWKRRWNLKRQGQSSEHISGRFSLDRLRFAISPFKRGLFNQELLHSVVLFFPLSLSPCQTLCRSSGFWMKLILKNWFIANWGWLTASVATFPDACTLASPSNFQEGICKCFWCVRCVGIYSCC